MRDEQKIIAAWMQQQMARHDLSPEKWARRAELSSTTVSRAVQKSYTGVSSVPTLVKLAESIDEPTILDFLKLGWEVAPAEQVEHVLELIFLRGLQHEGIYDDERIERAALFAKVTAEALLLLRRNDAWTDDAIEVAVDAVFSRWNGQS